MTAVRVVVRAPRSGASRWYPIAGASLGLHVAVTLVAVFGPEVFRPSTKFPPVYTVDLVALPAGPTGPPAGSPKAVAPPAPPPPAKTEPAVKIPEKPTTVPKVKAPKKKPEPIPTKPPKTTAAPAPAPPVEKTPEKPAPEGAAGTAASGIATPGAPGAGVPGETGGGGGGFLDDASFEYGWYLSTMSSILSRNWARPYRPDLNRTLRAVVHYRVMKDGQLTEITLEQSSGDAELDRSALRAVQDSNPLPPLPYQYGKDSLGVHFYFDVKPE